MWWTAKKRRLEKIRQRWGRCRLQADAKDRPYFPLVAAYAAVNKEPAWHQLNTQTGSDIDFEDVFCFTDHTNSRIGQQFLYDRLLKPGNDETALRDLDHQARYFSENPAAREKTQTLLAKLDHPDTYYIQLLLEEKLFVRPKWVPLAIADTGIVILLLIGALFRPALLMALMVPFALNLVLHLRNKNHTHRFIKSFPQLNILIKVTRRLLLEKLPLDGTGVAESLSGLKGFQRKFKYLSFGQTGGSDVEMLYYWLLEVLKVLFLVELHSFYRLIQELQQQHSDIQRIFRYVGSVDLAISVASLRAGDTPTCTPTFLPPSARVRVRDLAHPLIRNCVLNSLDVKEKGVLITGSNMSGKTTFLRTLGINSLLAQTIYTCLATEYTAPAFRLFSSIRIDDSILDGKSYYFEEVNVMGELIAAATSEMPNLYLLDEVFKGTNMVERIAAAKAILTYLKEKGHIVVVSTHDLELSDMLKEDYDLYHFEETLQEGELQFDHLLKPGPLRTRNAIRLLALAGYPAAIIRDANSTSHQLTAGQTPPTLPRD